MFARLAYSTSFAALVLFSSLGRAVADDATTPTDHGAPAVTAKAETTAHLGFGVNLPLSWKDGDAVGISAYVGLTAHQAIRANFATYKYGANIAGDVISFAAGGDGDESSRHGRITDVGAAWMYFPRRLWDGFSIEAGVLRRDRDTNVYDEYASNQSVDTLSTTYAARAMVGWSWLVADRVFVAASAGLSAGYEYGSETDTSRASNPMPMPMLPYQEISRFAVSGEGLLRFGLAFDM